MKPSRQMHDLLDKGTKKKPKHSHENTSSSSHIHFNSLSQVTLFGPLLPKFDFNIISKFISHLEVKDLIKAGTINKEWNKFLQPMITFPALFSAIATSPSFAMQTCLSFEDEIFTYQVLNQKINQLSQYLLDFCKRQQNPKESKIAVLLEASSDAIIAMLAIMKAGLVYVPLVVDADIAVNKLIQITEDCKPILTITHSKFVNHPYVSHLLATHNSIFYIDKEQALLKQFSTNHPLVTINANDAAYLLYTSGSTGASKGVLVEHAGLYNRYLSHKRLLQITSKDKIALFASLGFDASIMEIMMAFLSGATLYIVPSKIRLNILELGEFYLKNAITIAIFTPSMLRILNPRDFSHMRVIISTGEAIDKDTFMKWYWIDQANAKSRLFINGYGPVEATICTTLGVCTPESGLHIGNAIEGIEIFILEENPADVKKPKRVQEGDRGELYITGIGIARSYYGNSQLITDLNSKKFLTILHPDDHHKIIKQQRYIRVYRTSDAMRLQNGKLEFLD